jgi:hypothetical protein
VVGFLSTIHIIFSSNSSSLSLSEHICRGLWGMTNPLTYCYLFDTSLIKLSVDSPKHELRRAIRFMSSSVLHRRYQRSIGNSVRSIDVTSSSRQQGIRSRASVLDHSRERAQPHPIQPQMAHTNNAYYGTLQGLCRKWVLVEPD